jgi:hypothetical protein
MESSGAVRYVRYGPGVEHTVTCSVPAGTTLSVREVGTGVKRHCQMRDGRFRLAYLKSEHAVIELER